MIDLQTVAVIIGVLINILALIKVATIIERRFTKLELTQNDVLQPAVKETQNDVAEIKKAIESIKTRLLLTRKSDIEKLPDIMNIRKKGL
jgi:hypothetical protein